MQCNTLKGLLMVNVSWACIALRDSEAVNQPQGLFFSFMNAYEGNYVNKTRVLASNALRRHFFFFISRDTTCSDNSLSPWELVRFAQSLKQKSWLDSSNSQGAAESNYRASGWKSYRQGPFVTLPLIKARLPNKMNHAPLFLKPQHFGETSQTGIVCSLHRHLTAEDNNGSDLHSFLAGD